jgi:tetratricopeptide (TPR) repeat protein
MGRYAEAEPLYKQALEIRRTALGARHPDYANSLNNLAVLYDEMGRYAEAEPLYKQALEICRTALGERHPSYATSLNNLAELYRAMGRHADAEPLYKQALEIRRTVLGERHPSYATSLNNLAGLYRAMGRHAEAEPLLRQALEIRRTALGERHPDYATSLINLAELYREVGRHAEAEPLLRQALEIRRTALGERHPDYATSLINLAELYREVGRHAEAEPLLRQALELRERALGPVHPDTAISLNRLADLLRVRGRHEEAELLRTQGHFKGTTEREECVPTTCWHLDLLAPAEAELMVGRSYPFELRLTPDERPGSVPIRVPASALELTFFLEAPGFRLSVGEPTRTLPVVGGVPRERSLTFPLVPLLGGPQTLRLLGYAGGQVEGLAPAELALTVPVAAPVGLPDLPELVDQRKVPTPHPDVILYVSFEEHAGGRRLSFYVTCSAVGWLRRRLSPSLEMAEGELDRLRQAVVVAAAEGPDAAPADTLARLRALGAALFNRLMPPGHELRTFFRQAVRDTPPGARSWLVISDERAILPWELVCPSVFLADVFMLSHWVGRQGLKLTAEAPLGRLDLTHYDQRPRDLDHWRSALGGEEVVVESRTGYLYLLEPYSTCYGLHVLRYAERGRPGQVASADEAEARGGRGRAEAMIHDQRLDFTLRRPVVGLSFVDGQPPDAWESGSNGDTRLEAGWILPLLRAGASALVGPRWSVHPEADRLFFQTFYETIRGGETLGTASWRARQLVHQAFPTRSDWLAYAYFGHPRCEPYKVRRSRGFALFEALGHPDGAPFLTGETAEFRASYRTRPPVWFEGQLRAAQPSGPPGDLSVMVALLAAGEEPKTVPLVPVPGSDDCQGVVTFHMPDFETDLPLVVRFQQGDEELQTLMLTLKIVKGRP